MESGKDWSNERRHLRVLLYCNLEVWIGHPAVSIMIHLPQRHLDEVLDPLVPVLLRVALLHQAGLHHGDHLLLAESQTKG